MLVSGLKQRRGRPRTGAAVPEASVGSEAQLRVLTVGLMLKQTLAHSPKLTEAWFGVGSLTMEERVIFHLSVSPCAAMQMNTSPMARPPSPPLAPVTPQVVVKCIVSS